MHDNIGFSISALKSGRLDPLFLDWRQVLVRCCGGVKNLLLLPANEPRFLDFCGLFFVVSDSRDHITAYSSIFLS